LKAAGIVVDMIRMKKMAGRAILFAGMNITTLLALPLI